MAKKSKSDGNEMVDRGPAPNTIKITTYVDGDSYSIATVGPNLIVQGFLRSGTGGVNFAARNVVCQLVNLNDASVALSCPNPPQANGTNQWTATFNGQPAAGNYVLEAYNGASTDGSYLPKDSMIITVEK